MKDYKYITIKTIEDSYDLEIFNSFGHFVDPNSPIKIKDDDQFTFYAQGYDSLSIKFNIINSILKINPVNPGKIRQFIYDNKLHNKIMN